MIMLYGIWEFLAAFFFFVDENLERRVSLGLVRGMGEGWMDGICICNEFTIMLRWEEEKNF